MERKQNYKHNTCDLQDSQFQWCSQIGSIEQQHIEIEIESVEPGQKSTKADSDNKICWGQDRKVVFLASALVFCFLLLIGTFIALVIFVKRDLTQTDDISDDSLRQNQIFEDFQKAYSKVYQTEWEREWRFEIFVANLLYLDAFIKMNNITSYDLENAFSMFMDLTEEEFQSQYLGFNPAEIEFQVRQPTQILQIGTVPESVDWEKQGYVTQVKNQLNCGSCYIFAVVGAIESALMIKYSQKIDPLSEQSVLNCLKTSTSRGCNGGSLIDVLQYAMQNNINNQLDQPYIGRPGQCNGSKPLSPYKISSYGTVLPKNNTQLKAAVAQQPVIAAIDSSLLRLKGGRYYLDEIDCAGRNSLDHAVLIVGYYDGYYKLKNSWGSQWGINGYFYIKMSEVGLCGILEHALYPVV